MNFYPHKISDFKESKSLESLPCVYLIQTANREYVKIGKTKNLKSRLSIIKTSCPLKFSIIASINTPKHSEVEVYLLGILDHRRVNGEWFSLSENELCELEQFFSLTNKHVNDVFNLFGFH
tara:strand:- start:46 stop:408 length:363 start_codon:yes stop_codon:yes gene_type:complete